MAWSLSQILLINLVGTASKNEMVVTLGSIIVNYHTKKGLIDGLSNPKKTLVKHVLYLSTKKQALIII